jgi:hypothetical protein
MERAARILTRICLVGLALCAASISFTGCLRSNNDRTYRFDDDDPSTTFRFDFPPAELAARLDESGLFHGADSGPLLSSRSGWYDVGMDNTCRSALVEVRPLFDGTAIRLDQLSATNECKKNSRKAELVEMFQQDVLLRISGEKEPLSTVSASRGVQVDYPPDAAPSFLLAGSAADLARRLNENSLFQHEYHDGVYQLSGIACHGRFRITEEPNGSQVRITGISFAQPCFVASTQECLAELFWTFITGPNDPTRVPTTSPRPSAGTPLDEVPVDRGGRLAAVCRDQLFRGGSPTAVPTP